MPEIDAEELILLTVKKRVTVREDTPEVREQLRQAIADNLNRREQSLKLVAETDTQLEVELTKIRERQVAGRIR